MDSNLAIALFGYLSDHFGSRKLPFTLGLVSLCSSTILFAFARRPAVLVVARAFQGLSCAAVWVVGLVLLVDNIPQERIGQAMGYTTVGMTMGGLFGPMLGGVSYDFLGYYGVFIFPTLLIILDIILRFALIERPGIFSLLPLSAYHLLIILVTKQSLERESSRAEDTERNAQGTSADANPNPSNQWKTDEETPLLSTQRLGAKDSPKSSVLLLMRSSRLLIALLSAAMLCLVLSSLETVGNRKSHNNNADFRANFSIDRPTFCHGQIPLDSERRWVDFSSCLSHRDGVRIHYGKSSGPIWSTTPWISRLCSDRSGVLFPEIYSA